MAAGRSELISSYKFVVSVKKYIELKHLLSPHCYLFARTLYIVEQKPAVKVQRLKIGGSLKVILDAH